MNESGASAHYMYFGGHLRITLSTTANICRKLNILEAVSLLSNLLHHYDYKVSLNSKPFPIIFLL
jgi:hypothetical protein